MQVNSITFVRPGEVELHTSDLDIGSLGDTSVLMETEYSVVSAGTELAVLRGTESWAPLPFVPGYGAVGLARQVGPHVTGLAVGDRVFCYGEHRSVSVIDGGLMLKIPDGVDPRLAVMARIGQVSFTAVRTSAPELGDTVAVIGLGLVGNLAAQLFRLAGCRVIGLDVSPRRLATARACEVDEVVNTAEVDPTAAVRDLTGGAMCEIVVEASGVPNMAHAAAKLAGRNGQVVLLGSPRGQFTADAMEVLNAVHLWGNCVTLKGAHEWRYPLRRDPGGHVKHSIERNVRQFLGFIQSGKMHLEELISHTVSPRLCQEVYANLQARNEDYFGVVYDWMKDR